MKVAVALDSFKGSMSSMEAGNAVKEGILRAIPDAEVVVRPLADGGEGTAEALTGGMGGEWVRLQVTGPQGSPVQASYGMIPASGTAILEMSAAAGITLVPPEERNPLNTTTYGVGEMIRDAIGRGCRHFLIGIGGSATNDGGIGMLQALGFGILDGNGNQVVRAGRGLKDLRRITTDHVVPELADCDFRIACDVTNPLCGEQGASAVYGPQKGADPQIVRDMDGWLAAYAEAAKSVSDKADPDHPGAGAAGGLGFAFLTFFDAVLESGIDMVLRETKLDDYVKGSDFVVTGEGRLDGQTVMGKAPVGVARVAGAHRIPVIAFAGSVADDAVKCNSAGIHAFFPILRKVATLEEVMESETARENLSATAEQVFRLIQVSRR